MTEPGQEVLVVNNLTVDITTRRSTLRVLDSVSLELTTGEMHGLVGETGSGKSMTAKGILGLLPHNARAVAGSVDLNGLELLGMPEERLRELRGAVIGAVFQNPRTALYPMLPISRQIANVIDSHSDISSSECRQKVLTSLGRCGIPDAERVASAYPHELSGGLAQRVVIAMALSCGPRILVADEPTTGLDVTIQRQILDLLSALQRDMSLSVLMITHDLGVVAQYCDTTSVMHDGRVVETGSVRQVLLAPTAAYTRQLVAASDVSSIRSRQAAVKQ